MNAQEKPYGNYIAVNGLNMYYEIHGKGQPLVLIHGGGSTITSNFGSIIPELAKTHLVVAVELQAHGRTKDIERPLSFEQDADDVAGLLNQLRIGKADILGFSNGGTTTLQIAIRHPQIVKSIILASTLFKRDGMFPGFFEGMEKATIDQMPAPLTAAFLEVNPDKAALKKMFDRDVARMINFKDIPIATINAIQSPAFIINGDAEVVLAEHALLLCRSLPAARVLIIPSGHGDYIGEICAPVKNAKQIQFVVDSINDFLAGRK